MTILTAALMHSIDAGRRKIFRFCLRAASIAAFFSQAPCMKTNPERKKPLKA
jgi:hypothetical protein